MKTKLNLGNIKVKELGLEINNVSVEAKYSIEEMFKVVDLVKYATASLPEIFENLANAYLTFENISDTIANLEADKEEDEYMEGCCPVRLPSKEDMIKDVFSCIAGELRNKESVSEENSQKEDMEENLKETISDISKSGLPDFLKNEIIESLKEDVREGRVIIKRKDK